MGTRICGSEITPILLPQLWRGREGDAEEEIVRVVLARVEFVAALEAGGVGRKRADAEDE